MYAVISDRNRQHTVRKGDVILCDLTASAKKGDTVTFDQVLLIGSEGKVSIGKPFVAKAQVTGEVLGLVRGEKLVVFRFKRRKNVRKKRGHRQSYTQVKIQEIRG